MRAIDLIERLLEDCGECPSDKPKAPRAKLAKKRRVGEAVDIPGYGEDAKHSDFHGPLSDYDPEADAEERFDQLIRDVRLDGEDSMGEIARIFGYRDANDFFADNDGALEAIREWVSGQGQGLIDRIREEFKSQVEAGETNFEGDIDNDDEIMDFILSTVEGHGSYLEELAYAFGYDRRGSFYQNPVDYFLSDNPGAIEAVVEWMRDHDADGYVQRALEYGQDEDGIHGNDQGEDEYETDYERYQRTPPPPPVVRPEPQDKGTPDLKDLVKQSGHDSIDAFLQANPGAADALKAWIQSNKA